MCLDIRFCVWPCCVVCVSACLTVVLTAGVLHQLTILVCSNLAAGYVLVALVLMQIHEIECL